ncbi:MAG: hypothetical protein FJX72_20030, partial [Armatimonadetes bacterium]|nr:hypothetical protein [Armatimonadota bacterium]
MSACRSGMSRARWPSGGSTVPEAATPDRRADGSSATSAVCDQQPWGMYMQGSSTGAALHRAFLIALMAAACAPMCFAADWPQWRGPLRDGVSSEKGLLKAWPDGGPKLLWQATGLGTGYSSLSIVGGRAYTMGDVAGPSGAKQQCVIALDLKTRKRIWTAQVGRPHSDGSRCTPTVSNGLIYAVGTDGDIVCVEASGGREVWRANLERDFGGRMMSGWRFSESPLVDGEKVIVTPGSASSTVVALNRKTGKLIWRCAAGDIGQNGADGAGYSSAVVMTLGRTRTYVQQYGRGVIGMDAGTGKLLWSHNRVACGTANIMTPVVSGPYVFVSNAYRAGAVCLSLTATADGVNAREVYFLDARTLQNHHGGT